MRVEITDTNLAYQVKLSAPGAMFGELLAVFKDEIPHSCRCFISDGQYWHVERRAINALRGFVEYARAMGALVIEQAAPCEVQTIEQMADASDTPEMSLRKARARGYLRVSSANESSLSLQHRMTCRAEGSPMIQLIKQPRWAELAVTTNGGAVTDAVKLTIFQTLLAAVMAAGKVRVSNREIRATRLPFGLAEDIARWLVVEVLNDERSIIQGDDNGREWSRFEARRRDDGSIVMIHQPAASALVA
jgi:hypothetical protein